MVAKYNIALKLAAGAVTPDSVVTIWVDRQVASHPLVVVASNSDYVQRYGGEYCLY